MNPYEPDDELLPPQGPWDDLSTGAGDRLADLPDLGDDEFQLALASLDALQLDEAPAAELSFAFEPSELDIPDVFAHLRDEEYLGRQDDPLDEALAVVPAAAATPRVDAALHELESWLEAVVQARRRRRLEP